MDLTESGKPGKSFLKKQQLSKIRELMMLSQSVNNEYFRQNN
jgi:hypothetical protein